MTMTSACNGRKWNFKNKIFLVLIFTISIYRIFSNQLRSSSLLDVRSLQESPDYKLPVFINISTTNATDDNRIMFVEHREMVSDSNNGTSEDEKTIARIVVAQSTNISKPVLRVKTAAASTTTLTQTTTTTLTQTTTTDTRTDITTATITPTVANLEEKAAEVPPGTATAATTTTTATSTTRIHPIVLHYSHWKDLERFVQGIWSKNLFCDTISDVVKKHYNDRSNPLDITQQNTIVPIKEDVPIPTIHMTFELSCQDLYRHSVEGTGNYIQAIYMMRLSIKYIPDANIKLNITCTDDKTKHVRTDYILPWFTGVWYSPNYNNNDPRLQRNSSISNTDKQIRLQGQQHVHSDEGIMRQLRDDTKRSYCHSFYTQPTAIMIKEMRYDVRRMVVALMVNTKDLLRQSNTGDVLPHRRKILNFCRNQIYSNFTNKITQNVPSREAYLLPGNQQERIDFQTTHVVPLLDEPLSYKDLDDAVIHFRCGDLLSTNLTSYGFLTFYGYSRHINRTTTRTIGIVTQPLVDREIENTTIQMRNLDSSNIIQVQRCRTLVYAFVDYLQEQFPNTTVTVRNNVSDSIAVTYIRMVLAKQVVGSKSTFSAFPVLGTFGTGYYLYPKEYEPSIWMVHPSFPITKTLDANNNNVVLFRDDNTLVGSQTKDLWDQHGDEAVLNWFRTGERNFSISYTTI